jgi:hypothetical protein
VRSFQIGHRWRIISSRISRNRVCDPIQQREEHAAQQRQNNEPNIHLPALHFAAFLPFANFALFFAQRATAIFRA